MVRLLLQLGADANFESRTSKAPLMVAIEQGN